MKTFRAIFFLIGISAAFSAKAQSFIDSLETSLKKLPRNTEYVDALNQLALEYSRIDLKETNKYSSIALAMSDSMQYKKGMADAYYGKSLVARQISNYPEELELGLKAIKIYEELGDNTRIAECYVQIATIHSQQGDSKLSVFYYQKAFEIFKSTNNLHGQAMVLRRIGNNYLEGKQYDSAYFYYGTALKLEEKLNNRFGIAACLNNIGLIKSETHNYDEALKFLYQSLAISKKVNNLNRIPAAYHNIGRAYLGKNSLDSALSAAAKGRALAHEINNKSAILEAELLLSEIYASKKKYDKAYFHLSLYKKNLDSLRISETAVRVAQMEALHINQKLLLVQKEREQEHARLAYENRLANSRLLIIALAPFLVLSISALVIISLRSKIRKERFIVMKREQAMVSEFNSQIARLELNALKAQLNPHFIFNTLNLINRYIVKANPEQASDYIVKFSKLIRLMLENSNSSKVPLWREIKLLTLYLELEAARLDDHFEYEIKVNEDVKDGFLYIPTMIIQPHVENAIWHRLLPKKEPGKLIITFQQLDKYLCCTIEDNGISESDATKYRMDNILKKKYADGFIASERLDLINKSHGENSYIISELILNESETTIGTKVIIMFEEKLEPAEN